MSRAVGREPLGGGGGRKGAGEDGRRRVRTALIVKGGIMERPDQRTESEALQERWWPKERECLGW